MNSEALNYYRNPTDAELLTSLEIGTRIAIYWDGDDEYYPCTITGIVDIDGSNHHKYTVLYEEDDSELHYEEDLSKSKYMIWSGTEEQYAQERLVAMNVCRNHALYKAYLF